MKKILRDILADYAREKCWEVRHLGDGWITHVQTEHGQFFIHGYAFPLNNAASFLLAKDKAAASVVLAVRGIPCVPHRLVLAPAVAREWYGDKGSIADQLSGICAAFGEDLVLKPNDGFSGHGVVHTETFDAALREVEDALRNARDHAVSPYIPSVREVRVVLLDGNVLCLFEKKLGTDWRHNLAQGATAIPLEDTEETALCSDLAQAAASAMSLRLCSVDIFLTETGPMVIEVNSGVMIEKMATQLPGGMDIARCVYGSVLGAVETDLRLSNRSI